MTGWFEPQPGSPGADLAGLADRELAGGEVDYELVAEIRRVVADQLTAHATAQQADGHAMSDVDRQELARHLIGVELHRRGQARVHMGSQPLPAAEEAAIARAVHAALFGAGRLEPLLEDPNIENIDAVGCDGVWITYADGTQEPGPPIADSDAELVEMLRMLAARVGLSERRFDLGSPRLNLRLPSGDRLFAVMAVTPRPAVSIRRHRLVQVTLDDLRRLGSIDAHLQAFLRAAVLARKNLVVAGGTNAGKTTLLRALAAEIPERERLVTIEQSLELGLHELPGRRGRVVALEAREANTEGEGAVSMAELVRYGLRLNPSRVIVGEVLGNEVLSMLNAMSQGNDGSMCTIHAESSEYVFRRIATYAIQAPERLPVAATNLLIAGAVDFVVWIGQRDQTPFGGRHERYVASVREVVGADGDQVLSNEVFAPGPDGRALPAAPIRCVHDLMAYGYHPDPDQAGGAGPAGNGRPLGPGSRTYPPGYGLGDGPGHGPGSGPQSGGGGWLR